MADIAWQSTGGSATVLHNINSILGFDIFRAREEHVVDRVDDAAILTRKESGNNSMFNKTAKHDYNYPHFTTKSAMSKCILT